MLHRQSKTAATVYAGVVQDCWVTHTGVEDTMSVLQNLVSLDDKLNLWVSVQKRKGIFYICPYIVPGLHGGAQCHICPNFGSAQATGYWLQRSGLGVGRWAVTRQHSLGALDLFGYSIELSALFCYGAILCCFTTVN
jgi:hypothetical protein